MLEAICSTIPEIYPFCHLSYSESCNLKFGQYQISSDEGIQQGDPLGSMAFCQTIQPILRSLGSEFIAGFMDYITLGGPAVTVAQDVNMIIHECETKGLHLNIIKCELISKLGLPPISPLDQF